MTDAVLDASAVLAVVLGEPGAQVVEETLVAGRAIISAVNLAEVVSKLNERGMSDSAIRSSIATLGLEIVPVGAAVAYEAGFLRRATRPHGLSTGDRLCIATAAAIGLPVITTDREWVRPQLPVTVILARV